MPERKNPHHTGTKPPAYTPNSPATAKRRTEKHRGGASGNIEGIEKTGYTEMQRVCRRTSGTDSPDGTAGQPLRKATQTNAPERISRKPPRNTLPRYNARTYDNSTQQHPRNNSPQRPTHTTNPRPHTTTPAEQLPATKNNGPHPSAARCFSVEAEAITSRFSYRSVLRSGS